MTTKKRGRDDDDDAEAAVRAERKATMTEAGLRILTAINQVITQLPAEDDTLALMHKIRDLATLEFASTYLRDYEKRRRKKRAAQDTNPYPGIKAPVERIPFVIPVELPPQRVSWFKYLTEHGYEFTAIRASNQALHIDLTLRKRYYDEHGTYPPTDESDFEFSMFTVPQLDKWAADAVKQYNEECSCKHPDFGWIPVELPKPPINHTVVD